MQLHLQQVFPSFLDAGNLAASQVWLQNIVFSKNEHVHIVAPSGSGKTSLVHFLYGLRNDYEGSIRFRNEEIKTADAEKLAVWRQQHISIVFQDLRLFINQTVMQNLEIKRLLNPFHQSSRIEDMCRRLGIQSKLTACCSTCSYGEQQRIAIIRALQQPFDFLLLDEPFSHLDENNRIKAMELMEEEAAARNASIILADLKEITYFKAERLLKMA